MGCISSIHIGDVGTSLEFEITDCIDGSPYPVDLTSNTGIAIRFLKPDNTTLDVTGLIYTGGTNGDATDGIVQYVTQPGDINVIGKWKVQVTISFATGIFNSNIDKTIKVLDNLG